MAKEGLQRAVVPSTTATTRSDEIVVEAQQSYIKRFFGPLALLAPKKVLRQDGGYSRDWSLTILSVSFFLYLLSMVSQSDAWDEYKGKLLTDFVPVAA